MLIMLIMMLVLLLLLLPSMMVTMILCTNFMLHVLLCSCARRRAPILRKSLENLSCVIRHREQHGWTQVLVEVAFLAGVMFFLLLLLAGDIELNPG